MGGMAVFLFSAQTTLRFFRRIGTLAYNAFLSAVFLVASVRLKRNERLAKYWQIPFAFSSLLSLFSSRYSSTD